MVKKHVYYSVHVKDELASASSLSSYFSENQPRLPSEILMTSSPDTLSVIQEWKSVLASRSRTCDRTRLLSQHQFHSLNERHSLCTVLYVSPLCVCIFHFTFDGELLRAAFCPVSFLAIDQAGVLCWRIYPIGAWYIDTEPDFY